MNENNWPLGDAENGLSFFRRRMLDKNYYTQQLWSVSYDLSKINAFGYCDFWNSE